jgi:uncharacterized spore protein YtfJ
MTDETIQTPKASPEMDNGRALTIMQETMDNFLSAASVDAVYGKPVQNGDTVIIPTAEVLSGLGFGMGFGGGEGADDDGKPAQGSGGSGGGGGGGGRVFSRPVALVIASPEGVRVEPVVDVTKLGLAALTALGFMIGMLARMRNPQRNFDECCEE